MFSLLSALRLKRSAGSNLMWIFITACRWIINDACILFSVAPFSFPLYIISFFSYFFFLCCCSSHSAIDSFHFYSDNHSTGTLSIQFGLIFKMIPASHRPAPIYFDFSLSLLSCLLLIRFVGIILAHLNNYMYLNNSPPKLIHFGLRTWTVDLGSLAHRRRPSTSTTNKQIVTRNVFRWYFSFTFDFCFSSRTSLLMLFI